MKSKKTMYCLVPYNLSPIQQGIQASHAIVEYSLKESSSIQHLYQQWALNHKTIIILNAGTTGHFSSMENHKKNLDKLKVEYSTFREPDLNNTMTAIVFITDSEDDSHIVGYLKQMRLA